MYRRDKNLRKATTCLAPHSTTQCMLSFLAGAPYSSPLGDEYGLRRALSWPAGQIRARIFWRVQLLNDTMLPRICPEHFQPKPRHALHLLAGFDLK